MSNDDSIATNQPDGSRASDRSILTLNAGSSSLKFAVFGSEPAAILRGEVVGLDDAPHFIAHDPSGNVLSEERWAAGRGDQFAKALDIVLRFTTAHVGDNQLAAVGHRVVHGGADHCAPAIVTPDRLSKLEALIPFDPLHMPLNLAPIRAITAAHPGLPQVVCFDTAFHRTMPLVARSFALPREISAAGIQRYGFHGLSFDWIAGQLVQRHPDIALKKVIVAHLGAGASLCALMNGKSVATTMAFTTLDGLMMATRCGALDPGVVLYLARQKRSLDDIEDMLYRRSGLLGVSGLSGDIRVLAASADPHAREAIDLYVYRLIVEIGAMTAALGGLDALVFTAGIGSHSAMIRAAVGERLAWIGLRLDAEANASGADCISTADSLVEVLVLTTDEEAVIARETRACFERSCDH